MIIFKNVKYTDGQIGDLQIASQQEQTLEANGLLVLPALIDSHISLGLPERGNWATAIHSLVESGFTTVLDIPSIDENLHDLEKKKQRIDQSLATLKIPLTYYLYGKGNSADLDAMGFEKKNMVGSVILIHDHSELSEKMWDRIFQMAAWKDLPVLINTQNEKPKTKENLLDKAISYAEKQNARLYVLNIATQEELDLVKKGRARSLLIYTETTPQHLIQADFLWDAIHRGEIEAIGSGYQVEAQGQEQGQEISNPSFLLPYLMTAHLEGKITLERLVHLTRTSLFDIFEIETWKSKDFVLVDLEKERSLSGMKLKGWPAYTIMKGEIFKNKQVT